MKKLISSLAYIPFSVIMQPISDPAVCYYALKTLFSQFAFQNGYNTHLAMDMRTHGCSFSTEKPITITKVGYRAWKQGIAYRISLWKVGYDHALTTCLISPSSTEAIEFVSLPEPVLIEHGKIYYITRTYVENGADDDLSDCVGWLKRKEGGSVFPVKQEVITLINGFFSDDVNPLQSDRMSNICTTALLPFVDFEYTLQY